MLKLLFSLGIFLYFQVITHQTSIPINTYFQTTCNSSFTYTLSPINDYYVSNYNFTICSNIIIQSSIINAGIAIQFISVRFNIENGSNFTLIGCAISFNYSSYSIPLSVFSLNQGSSIQIQVQFIKYARK